MTNPPHPITILGIGAGGTGSQIINGLARMNNALLALRHPGIFVNWYDGEPVRESCVGRQLFTSQDIGKNKADVCISRINVAFGYGWIGIPYNFDIAQNFGSCNIIISCVDRFDTRIMIDKAFHSNRNSYDEHRCYYIIDIGNDKDFGQVILGSKDIDQPKSQFETVNVLPTFSEYQFTPNDNEEDKSCSVLQSLNRQDLYINQHMATFTLDMIWKLLNSFMIDYKGLYFNASTMKLAPILL